MVARSKKQISKDRALRKRILKEKARLRARKAVKKVYKKSSPVYRVRVKLNLETREKLHKYCVMNNKKPYKVIREVLRSMMLEDENKLLGEKNGI